MAISDVIVYIVSATGRDLPVPGSTERGRDSVHGYYDDIFR